jgi:hypothetical protein
VPVAWREIGNGISGADLDKDFTEPNVQWNHEQTVLRSLERRGLVTLDRYLFEAEAVSDVLGGPEIEWRHTPRGAYPGDTRITRTMIGAMLTPAGWALVRSGASEVRTLELS